MIVTGTYINMSKKRKLSLSAEEEQHQSRGTGSLLQDLLSSTVLVKTVKLTNFQTESHPLQVQDKHLPSTPLTLTHEKRIESCSICGSRNENRQPFTQTEMEILGEFILTPFLVSAAAAKNLATMFHWLCPGCYGTLEKLAKLKKEIDVITTSVRAIVRIQLKKNGFAPFDKLKEKENDNMTSGMLRNAVKSSQLINQGPPSRTLTQEIIQPEIMTDIDTDDDDEAELDIGDDENPEEKDADDVNCRTGENIENTGMNQERPVCNECGTSFSQVFSLHRHQKNFHKGSQSSCNRNNGGGENHTTQKTKPKSGKETVKCSVCMLDYSSEYSFGRHLQSLLHKVGANSRKINANGATTYACDMCPEEFTLLAELVSHKRSLHKNTATSQDVIEGQSGMNNNEHFEIKIDPNEEDDDDEMKPVVLNSEFDIPDVQADQSSSNQVSSVLTENPSQSLGNVVVLTFTPFVEGNAVDNPTNSQGVVVAAMQSNLTDRGPTEDDVQIVEEEVLTKRKSRARAEEALHAMSKNNTEDDANDGEEAEGSDANIDEEEDESDSSYDGESDTESLFEVESVTRKRRVKRIPSDQLETDCIVCGEKCPNPEALKLHETQHIYPMNCDICVRNDITSKNSYRHHLLSKSHELAKTRRREHDGQITFSCEKCDQPFPSASCLLSHMFNDHSEEATVKRQSFKARRCEPCDKTFKKPSQLRDHLLTKSHAVKVRGEDGLEEGEKQNDGESDHRKNGEKIRCEPCNRDFKFNTSLKEHLRSKGHVLKVGGEEALAELESKTKFICETCDKRFLSEKKFKQHKQRGHGTFVCDVCGKVLSNSNNLHYHMTHVHSGKPKTIPRPANRFVAPQDKSFACKICHKRFADRVGLYRHLKSIHEGHRYKCDLCPKEFVGSNMLVRHKRMLHTGGVQQKEKAKITLTRHTCDICSKMIVGKTNLTRHMEFKHFPNKDSCPYGCPVKIGTKEEWIVHLEQCKSEKMTEESKCYCFFCGELFSNQLLKIAHHLRLHTSYPCEFCPRTFTSSNFRSLHVYEHEESKPWLCTKCGKRFRQELNLKYHSTTVCGDDEVAKQELITKRRELHKIYREKGKPHKCNQCSKGFITEYGLEVHKKKAQCGIKKKREKGKRKTRMESGSEEEEESDEESEEDAIGDEDDSSDST